MTVLATCTGDTTLRQMLTTLRDRVLSHLAPRVVLGEGLHRNRAEYERPDLALDVRWKDSSPSLCTHTTASTTRHLLDALAYALTLHDDALCSKHAYAEWRANTMIVAARLHPHTVDASACGILPAMVALEGHPLIDTVYVQNEENAGEKECVAVLCTLRDACARRYGFRKGDVVTREDAWWATVQRGTRSWRLALTLREGDKLPDSVTSMERARTVREMMALGRDAIVPNAPSLTVDVTACFDRRSWSFASP